MNTFFKRTSLVIGIIIVTATFSGCSIFKNNVQLYETELEVWGVFDDSLDYGQIFKEYTELNPFVSSITFRKFPIEDYERELIDALAAGNGPDMFMINNSWTQDYINKIAPAPQGFINEKQLREIFVDVVADDFLIDGETYAVPLSVDSLALYYNKDMFSAAGIVQPPKTWEEFSNVVEKLTEIDQFGNIVRAGASIGTGKNINRSADIMTVLFLQSGVEITSNTSQFKLSHYVKSEGKSVNAGEHALRFYTSFASPSLSVYTWNRRQHYSIDAFVEGNVGMMLNHSWHYDTIRRKNEKLRFAVAPIPQLDNKQKINTANYWGFAVAKNKQPKERQNGDVSVSNDIRIHEAWEFLTYLTMHNSKEFRIIHGETGETRQKSAQLDPAKDYIERTTKPAARRDIIIEQKTHPVLSPFADGNLKARSWQRKNASAIDGVLVDMIESVNLGEKTLSKALSNAESRITQLLK